MNNNVSPKYVGSAILWNYFTILKYQRISALPRANSLEQQFAREAKGCDEILQESWVLTKISKIDNSISFVNVAFILKPPIDNQSPFCLINLSLG